MCKTDCNSCKCKKSSVKKYLGITINEDVTNRLSEQAQQLLKKFYMRKNETIQEGYARACVAWSTFEGVTDYKLAQRLYSYTAKGWFGFASPVLSNAPLEGEKISGLPISCFAGFVPDSLEGLVEHSTEFRWLSVKGGGYGSHWGAVRSVSDKAPGPIPFIRTMDADAMAYKQGLVRRGSYVAYLPVSHPDIYEHVQLRVPTGDANRKCLGTGFHNAVTIPDTFMQAVANNDDWDLIDPADGSVRETIKARELWETILETRVRTGEPYLTFIDTANRAMPLAQLKKGLKINGSNLCNEIYLATGIDYNDKMRTFVCCLSSINLEKLEEWNSSPQIVRRFIGDLIRMLDNVLQYFIDNAPDTIDAARYSAEMERALGLGVMGYHSFFQKQGVLYDSDKAVALGGDISKYIKKYAVEESKILANERGEPEDMKGTGLRNSHLMAYAPTANNATIVGTSAGTELIKANVYAHRTRAGTHFVKNRNLEEVLETYGMNTEEVWKSISESRGSIQHLEGISDWHKSLYKTAIEVDQMWVIKHTAEMQKHVCQGISCNLFFQPGATKSYISRVHRAAWTKGLKGLYYYRTERSAQAEVISKKLVRDALTDYVTPEEDAACVACEG